MGSRAPFVGGALVSPWNRYLSAILIAIAIHFAALNDDTIVQNGNAIVLRDVSVVIIAAGEVYASIRDTLARSFCNSWMRSRFLTSASIKGKPSMAQTSSEKY